MWKPRLKFRRGKWYTDFLPYYTWLRMSIAEKMRLDQARRHINKLNGKVK